MTRWPRLKHALVLLPLAFFAWNVYAALDFGTHWDEPFLASSVAHTAQTGEFLPLYYNYPSAAYWLGTAASLPAVLRGDEAAITGPEGLLTMRVAFALVFCVAVVMTYGLAYVVRRNVWVALSAAGVFALSWEVVYHARWIAPDGLVVLAVPLTTLLCWQAITTQDHRWLYMAAVAGGLAVGSKYNAGLFALAVPSSAVLLWRVERDNRRLLREMILLGVVGLGTFLLSTPGAVLDSGHFIDNVNEEIIHYGELGHHNHTVAAYWPHLARNLTYLGAVLFSPYAPVALLVSGFVLAGALWLWRYDRRAVGLLVGLPVLYLLYMSTQIVMIVRNLLVLAPFLAALAAFGIGWLWDGLAQYSRRLAYAVPVGLILLAGLNAVWLIETTQSVIQRGDRDGYTQAVMAHISNHPEQTFCIGSALSFEFGQRGFEAGNIRYFQPTDHIIYAQDEVNGLAVQANWPGLYTRIFGPQEVNWDYYPDWIGNFRYIMIDGEAAAARNVDIGNCQPQAAATP
jgi:hypothetical protein